MLIWYHKYLCTHFNKFLQSRSLYKNRDVYSASNIVKVPYTNCIAHCSAVTPHLCDIASSKSLSNRNSLTAFVGNCSVRHFHGPCNFICKSTTAKSTNNLKPVVRQKPQCAEVIHSKSRHEAFTEWQEKNLHIERVQNISPFFQKVACIMYRLKVSKELVVCYYCTRMIYVTQVLSVAALPLESTGAQIIIHCITPDAQKHRFGWNALICKALQLIVVFFNEHLSVSPGLVQWRVESSRWRRLIISGSGQSRIPGWVIICTGRPDNRKIAELGPTETRIVAALNSRQAPQCGGCARMTVRCR